MALTAFWRLVPCVVPLVLAVVVRDRFLLSVLAIASAQALYVASWDLLGGVAALPSLGHALPMGAGAYVAAIIGGWPLAPLPVALAGGALAGSLLAGFQGALSARLHRLSIVLVTLATAECARELSGMLAFAWPGGVIVGGDAGIPLTLFPADEAGAARLAAAALAVALVVFLCVKASGLGLAMRTTSADDQGAAAAGIDVTRVRVLTFGIAGGAAGCSGALAACLVGRAAPAMFGLEHSLFAFAIAGCAAPGTILGPAALAYAVTAALQWFDVPAHLRLSLYAGLLLTATFGRYIAGRRQGVACAGASPAPARAR